MTKINNMDDFKNITSNITSFSHAYLFNTNSLESAYSYVKEFAKLIILGNNYDLNNKDNNLIEYKIDHNEFDDLYIVNPDTIGINTEEINKLMEYMETKSLYNNGKRVYIIYGFERLSSIVSNKILKFLEEPVEGVYALLITENIDKILPTIISRCQVLNLTFEKNIEDIEKIDNMKDFLSFIIDNKNKTIAYINNYFSLNNVDRLLVYEDFAILEEIISNEINRKVIIKENKIYSLESLRNLPIEYLINILKITSNLKNLIKLNINLNLLIDRYIIEVTRELISCKE